MKIGQIGNIFGTVETVKYQSEMTFLDFDLLIVDMSFFSKGNFTPYYLSKRRNDFKEFCELRKVPVVVFLHSSLNFTAAGASMIEANILPIGNFMTTSETGRNISVISKTPYEDFLKKYLHLFQYKCFVSNLPADFKGLLETKIARKTVSCYNDDFIILPSLPQRPESEKEFLSELYGVITMKNGSKEIDLPDWTSKYYLPREKETVTDIDNIQKQIIEADKGLKLGKHKLSIIQTKKILLVGSGDALEDAVAGVFKEIGFTLHAVEHGRDDLIAEYGGKVSVVEIKGVTGTSAEKHAAQLEKWVANYKEEHERDVKGILIVNGFKDMELQSREAVFPHQMLKYSTQREHCLMTTIQLLGLYYRVQSNPEEKEQLINSMFETVGVYKGFEDWKDFIKQ